MMVTGTCIPPLSHHQKAGTDPGPVERSRGGVGHCHSSDLPPMPLHNGLPLWATQAEELLGGLGWRPDRRGTEWERGIMQLMTSAQSVVNRSNISRLRREMDLALSGGPGVRRHPPQRSRSGIPPWRINPIPSHPWAPYDL